MTDSNVGSDGGTGETAVEAATGPVDEPTLRTIGARAVETRQVTAQTFEPDAITPRSLRLRLDAGQYAAAVTAATLDVRWFETGDYSFHYRESRVGDETGAPGQDVADGWECRWDRHPKPWAPRAHFHPPPSATDVEPSPVDATHPLGVLFAVLDHVADRIESSYED